MRRLLLIGAVLCAIAIGVGSQSLVQQHNGYHRFDILDATTLKVGAATITFGLGTMDSSSACMDTLVKSGYDENTVIVATPLASSALYMTYYLHDDDTLVVAAWDSVGDPVHVDTYSYIIKD